jgi:hypothetical protein
LWLSVVGLIALVLVMEGVARHLPPDGVTVTTIEHYAVYTRIPSGERVSLDVRTTSRTTSADTAQTRAEIDTLSNAFAAASFTLSPYMSRSCMTLGGWVDYQVTFTWHGLPTQIWTSSGGCGTFTENSGGIPNVLWGRPLSVDGQQALHALQ